MTSLKSFTFLEESMLGLSLCGFVPQRRGLLLDCCCLHVRTAREDQVSANVAVCLFSPNFFLINKLCINKITCPAVVFFWDRFWQ